MENPYRSPTSEGHLTQRPRIVPRSKWPMVAAMAWTIFLILLLPAIPHRDESPGTFLMFKIITSIVSASAGLALLATPRGWWKISALPVVILLAFIQSAAWLNYP